jgi:hypothetical protein
MAYLFEILILGLIAGGCAIAAYEKLDATERQRDHPGTDAAALPRVIVLDGLPLIVAESTPQTSGRLRSVNPYAGGSASRDADSDRFDHRVRRVEERLDRLECEYERVLALAPVMLNTSRNNAEVRSDGISLPAPVNAQKGDNGCGETREHALAFVPLMRLP